MNDQPRKLVRNTDDKIIAGVASGVADFFGIDATIVRVLWALTVLFGGLGAIVYIVMWIVVPEGSSDHTVAHDVRDMTTGTSESTDTGSTSDSGLADESESDSTSG